jgi:tRNA threonylcarbamoyladenosine biosynthesis protein TsaB
VWLYANHSACCVPAHCQLPIAAIVLILSRNHEDAKEGPMILALDSASAALSLALYDGVEVIAEQTWRTENHHSRELAPSVAALFAQARLRPADLSAVAVCCGPGSYSGLRVGVALAKGLAAAQRLPLVGVSALDIMAAAQPHSDGNLCVAVAAGRGRIVSAPYAWGEGGWAATDAPQNNTWDELLPTLTAPTHMAAELDSAGHSAIAAAIANGAPLTLASGAQRLRRAGWLAQVAAARLSASEGGTAADAGTFAAARLLPIYVKTAGTQALG